jgi:hypothetical protein
MDSTVSTSMAIAGLGSDPNSLSARSTCAPDPRSVEVLLASRRRTDPLACDRRAACRAVDQVPSRWSCRPGHPPLRRAREARVPSPRPAPRAPTTPHTPALPPRSMSMRHRINVRRLASQAQRVPNSPQARGIARIMVGRLIEARDDASQPVMRCFWWAPRATGVDARGRARGAST